MNHSNSKNSLPKRPDCGNDGAPPRGVTIRRLFQFSLRTLLLLMVISAIGVWWYAQPEPPARDLPGGWKLRVQTVSEQDEATGEMYEVQEGLYLVVDQFGRTRCRGHVVDGQAAGRWTYYYPSGRKMLQGRCDQGCRVGTWTSWHENGRRQAQIEHGQPVWRTSDGEQYAKHPIADPVAEGEAMLSSGAAVRGTGLAVKKWGVQIWIASNRDGPARKWWDNGKLRAEGLFQDNVPHGPWRFFDRQGQPLSAGEFRRGKRHGKWIVLEPQSGEEVEAYYVGGQSTEPFDQLLPRLAKQLHSDLWRERREAGQMLAEIGGAGIRLLADSLDAGDGEHCRMVLAALVEQKAEAHSAVRKIEAIAMAEHTDPQLQIDALLALYEIDDKRRETHFLSLLDAVASLPARPRGDAVQRLADAGAYTPDLLQVALDDARQSRRFAAMSVLRIAVVRPQLWTYGSAPPPALDNDLFALVDQAAKHSDPRIAAAASAAKAQHEMNQQRAVGGSGANNQGGFF